MSVNIFFPFKIYSKDKKSRIGKISKHWGGIIKEFYTDADNFGISFPMDLDIRMKAVLLGACFLIVRIFFRQYLIAGLGFH